MTKIEIYSVFDSKTKVFGQPMYFLNKQTALRAWEVAANDRNSSIGQHPADYTLFHLGYWNDEQGRFENLDAHDNCGTALQYQNPNIVVPMNPTGAQIDQILKTAKKKKNQKKGARK